MPCCREYKIELYFRIIKLTTITLKSRGSWPKSLLSTAPRSDALSASEVKCLWPLPCFSPTFWSLTFIRKYKSWVLPHRKHITSPHKAQQEIIAVCCENRTEHTDTLCGQNTGFIYKNSVRTSQETHYISATKTNRLVLFREIIAV
jgi:hypothetical protein